MSDWLNGIIDASHIDNVKWLMQMYENRKNLKKKIRFLSCAEEIKKLRNAISTHNDCCDSVCRTRKNNSRCEAGSAERICAQCPRLWKISYPVDGRPSP